MKTNNMHLVPQVVIDCAENIFKGNRINEIYAARVEAIRDYCNSELQKYEAKKVQDLRNNTIFNTKKRK